MNGSLKLRWTVCLCCSYFFVRVSLKMPPRSALHCVDRMKEIQCDLFVEYEMRRGVGVLVRLFL